MSRKYHALFITVILLLCPTLLRLDPFRDSGALGTTTIIIVMLTLYPA